VDSLAEARSADGARVAEVELESTAEVRPAVAAARRLGVERLWVHASADLEAFGFRPAGAYVRMHADEIHTASSWELLRDKDYAPTLARAYLGLWGHKLVLPEAEPPEGAVVVGVYEQGRPIGLCRVFVADRLIDAPGVIPEARSPARYAGLLAAACATIGNGDASVDSWGDEDTTIEAYRSLGFEVVERVQGWELDL
jgi:hypothetical protein